MEVNPLSVIIVKSDSKGDRLLFRYPYEADTANENHDQKNGKRNPYALSVIEDLLQTAMPQTSNILKGQLTGFTDEVLSTLFAVKQELCHRKFELKVNDVRFVGHPTLLPFRANKDDGTSSTILINIVFALQASASHSIVKCYYDLSKRLGKALRFEEKRCAFLSEEMKIMITLHDELSSIGSDTEDISDIPDPVKPLETPSRSPFHHILQKSSLANSLKIVFEELSNTGVVQVRLNDWALVSFCLPHKAHQFHNRGLIIEPETIDRCLRSLRPYHGLLLLVDPNELLDSMPLDCSPYLLRLVMHYSPLKSLQTLAIESDLTISQIFQLTGHLVYWAKATIIYPLCESNVYVIAPDAQVHLSSPLVDKFSEDFPGLCLIQVMSLLSLPAPLWYPARTWVGGTALLARCIVWLLQRHLLLQLHTYIQFLPTALGPPVNGTKNYYCEKHNGPRHTLSDSLISLNNLPHTTPTTPSENSSDESFKRHDDLELIFPMSSNHMGIKNGENRFEYICDSEERNLFSKTNGKSFDYDKSITDNPKDVFRETSLIFGDITLDSITDSLPSSPLSLNSSRDIPQLINNLNNNKIDIAKELKIDKNGLSDSKIISDGDKLESRDRTHSVTNNNLKNILLTKLENDVDSDINKSPNNEIESSINKLKISEDVCKTDENNVCKKTNGQHEKEKPAINLITSNSSSGSIASEKKNANFKHSEMSFQPPTVISNTTHYNSCDIFDNSNKNSNASFNNGISEPFNEETLLADFTEEEKTALFKIPAAHNPEDLTLMATLHKKGYFHGEQHLEEIMFMENLTRSQVLQLIDKFRDVLITYETEDPAIAMLYSNV